jgi:hypothetical protein
MVIIVMLVAGSPAIPLDRRVSRRLAIVGMVCSVSLVAGLIGAYLVDPTAFTIAAAQPLRSALRRYYWVMFSGVAL